MRLLLISDTHGKIDLINDYAARVQADAVLHGGDFGFFDNGSYDRLSERELRLPIVHSNLDKKRKSELLSLSHEEIINITRQEQLLGQFQSFLDDERSLNLPVYAVWGNHEDKTVLENLLNGNVSIKNLHLIHPETVYKIGPVSVFGLGGNFLPGAKLLQKPIAGGAGKVWSTLSQYHSLVRTIDREEDDSAIRIFVSHVSPGKEPFVEYVAARTKANYTVSGHMGAPNCIVWNPFSLFSMDEAEKRLHDGLNAVRQACRKVANYREQEVEEAFDLIETLSDDKVHIGREGSGHRWYKETMHINLPDAPVGFAVMDVDSDDVTIQCFAPDSTE